MNIFVCIKKLALTPIAGASVTLGPIIRTNKTQEEGAAILEELVAKALDDGVIPIIIGGGNDQSAPNGKAFLNKFGGDQGQDAGVINLDAHLDVRQVINIQCIQVIV